jgi:hypothetical protein
VSDVLKSIFNPGKKATSVSGQLGASAGSRGGQFGHLGEKFADLGASQVSFKAEDHFDVNKQFNPGAYFDPAKLVKRY